MNEVICFEQGVRGIPARDSWFLCIYMQDQGDLAWQRDGPHSSKWDGVASMFSREWQSC